MEIAVHYCPHLTDDFFQILPEPGKDTLSIKRIKGEDYFLEFYDNAGKLIISCNYLSYMQSKIFDLSMYAGKEYILRVSNNDRVGICLYRITT